MTEAGEGGCPPQHSGALPVHAPRRGALAPRARLYLKDGCEAPDRGHGFGHELTSSRVVRVHHGASR
jgi:hypothetical protein